MKNLQTLATELAANKMTLVTNDMLNLRGGKGGTHKAKSVKAKSFKVKSHKVKSVKGGYGCGW